MLLRAAAVCELCVCVCVCARPDVLSGFLPVRGDLPAFIIIRAAGCG